MATVTQDNLGVGLRKLETLYPHRTYLCNTTCSTVYLEFAKTIQMIYCAKLSCYVLMLY